MKGNETDPATRRLGKEYDLRALCQLAALKPRWGVRPKRPIPSWVQNPSQCMGKAADRRGKTPSRRPKPIGLIAHKEENDQTYLTS